MRHVSQKKLTMFIKAAEILSIATACYNKLQITGARISYLMKKLLTERKLQLLISFAIIQTHEPPHGKTNNLHRRKQRRRSASR